eukprot:1454603-Rhodomonas_salina.1
MMAFKLLYETLRELTRCCCQCASSFRLCQAPSLKAIIMMMALSTLLARDDFKVAVNLPRPVTRKPDSEAARPRESGKGRLGT